MNFQRLITALALATTTWNAVAQSAPVLVENAWVRATVKGQLATGAFMTITSRDGARLVGASSPAAGVSQLHEMKLEAGVMKMGEVKGGLELPAGKAVALKAGGYHLMLMDLKAPLTPGSQMPLTLLFKDRNGVQSKLQLALPVLSAAPAGAGQRADTMMDHSMDGAVPAHQVP